MCGWVCPRLCLAWVTNRTPDPNFSKASDAGFGQEELGRKVHTKSRTEGSSHKLLRFPAFASASETHARLRREESKQHVIVT